MDCAVAAGRTAHATGFDFDVVPADPRAEDGTWPGAWIGRVALRTFIVIQHSEFSRFVLCQLEVVGPLTPSRQWDELGTGVLPW